MWYLKEAAKKASQAYNYSKSFIVSEDTTSPAVKLIDSLIQHQGQILPTSKMDQLVQLSYDIDTFEEVALQMFNRLKIFKYSLEGIKKAHNLLVLVSYLIKHGASGFIDEFRNSMIIFKNYQKLHKEKLFDENSKKQMDMENDIDTIKSKARHIELLLTDKAKLLKEKELAMLVKQKLKLYQQSKGGKLKQVQTKEERKKEREEEKSNPKMKKSSSQESDKDEKGGRLDYLNDLMEKYLWTYVDRVDDTVSNYSQKVLGKLDKFIDKVVDGEVRPEAFEFEDDDEIGQAEILEDAQIKPKTSSNQGQSSYQRLQEIKQDIDKLEIKNEDLLQFDDKKEKKEEKKQQKQNSNDLLTIDLLS